MPMENSKHLFQLGSNSFICVYLFKTWNLIFYDIESEKGYKFWIDFESLWNQVRPGKERNQVLTIYQALC